MPFGSAARRMRVQPSSPAVTTALLVGLRLDRDSAASSLQASTLPHLAPGAGAVPRTTAASSFSVIPQNAAGVSFSTPSPNAISSSQASGSAPDTRSGGFPPSLSSPPFRRLAAKRGADQFRGDLREARGAALGPHRGDLVVADLLARAAQPAPEMYERCRAPKVFRSRSARRVPRDRRRRTPASSSASAPSVRQSVRSRPSSSAEISPRCRFAILASHCRHCLA